MVLEVRIGFFVNIVYVIVMKKGVMFKMYIISKMMVVIGDLVCVCVMKFFEGICFVICNEFLCVFILCFCCVVLKMWYEM